MILRADAFALPFSDQSFDVVVADPPYALRSGNMHRSMRRGRPRPHGYISFCGRGWWPEAYRVVRPGGSLYIFATPYETHAWMRAVEEEPVDILSFTVSQAEARAPNGAPHRAACWRPIFHWMKAPRGFPRDGLGPAGINAFRCAAVQSHMHEALPWANQLPVAVITWLLRPHRGARVLDLFSGTGTTREAAVGLGLDVVSVELSPQAIEIIRRRPLQMGLPHPREE